MYTQYVTDHFKNHSPSVYVSPLETLTSDLSAPSQRNG